MIYICVDKDCSEINSCPHARHHKECSKPDNFKERQIKGYVCGYCVDITKERNEKLKKIQENI